MRPLSVVITTNNEEPNIGRTLAAVAFADEILVVDSFSTDRTVAIAREHGATVMERAYTGPADQKNWAIPRATHEWILLLDADEVVTPELAREITTLLAAPRIDKEAYWISRDNFFLGQPIRFSGWQNDRVIRFFHRDKARYRPVQVHEEIDTDGLQVGQLQGRLLHYTYRSLAHFLAKMERYADWSARDHAPRTGTITLYHLWIKPAFRFFKHFVWQQGFRDGRAGFMVSKIMAWGVFLRYAKLIEIRKNENHEN